MSNNIYKRSASISTPMDNKTEESRIVEGYAVIWDTPSEDMGFTETIARGAITEETILRSDVLCKYNHNDDKVLARCKYGEGSLTLTLDDKGLRYSFHAPKTALGDELLEHIRRGDIDRSSFAFSLSGEGADKWTKVEGRLYRTIYQIDRLYDVSPVWTPAYDATSVGTRSADDNIPNEITERVRAIETYHKELRERIDSL